jgi:hemolysin III
MPRLPDLDARPRFRGTSHQWAFAAAVVAGVLLVVLSPDARARTACAIYAATVAGLFGVSATYHRVGWRSERARRWMRRLDHSMIFLLIAGTYTPFALLALHGAVATAVLWTVWAGALGGIVLKLAWIDAPKWVTAAVYLALGWVAIVAVPQLVGDVGGTGTALVGLGGVLYTIGAVVYATRRPNPWPRTFGYHEVFHALVIAAAALHFAVVSAFVV